MVADGPCAGVRKRPHDVRCGAPDEAQVAGCAQASPDAPHVPTHALAAVLDPEPVALGMRLRLLEEEVVVAGADLDLEWKRRVLERAREASAAEHPVLPGGLERTKGT